MTAESRIGRAIAFGLAAACAAACLHAQASSSSGPLTHVPVTPPTIVDVVAASKTAIFSKDSRAETVCFEADCLPLKELLVLVAQRKQVSAAAAAQGQTVEAFKTAYAKSQADLGDCQTALGPWTKIGGAVAAGTSMIVDLPTLKAKIEAANPGKTIDATWKLIDRPKGQ